ncbi:MAG: geranylgeranyl reductase family protein [Methanotrichaceae archaeon]
MDKYDIAVIGAGPAGSMAAKYAAKAGANVALLEEHASIGWPVQCAGLLGTKALEASELSPGDFIKGGLKGATVYSPGCSKVSFKADSFKAWIVDRRLFDRSLALEAVRNGADLRLISQVRDMIWAKDSGGNSSILVLSSGEKIAAKAIILAEGVRASLSRKAGILPVGKILSGAQAELPFVVDDPEKVEVHLGIPGLFAWVIPIGHKSARVGLCTVENGCESLRAFLQSGLIKNRILGSPTALNVGGLPMGPPSSTVTNGFLAVGDAAGQVKPTSGGGIYPGLICAKIAGSVAAAAALEGDCSADRLKEYDKQWRAAIGRELDVGMRANRLLNRMSDKELDEVICYLARKPGLIRTIEEHGDIDRPSVLMAKMLPKLGFDGLKLAGLLRHILG